MTKMFPLLLIILDLAAAGVYLYQGDYAKGLYWGSAASITFATLLM